MTLSANTPRLNTLERTLSQASYQNLIINGNFDIWQRGTSLTADGYRADRFTAFANGSSAVTMTVTRDTDVPTLTQSGFQSLYSMKLVPLVTDATQSASDLYTLRYKVEGHDYAQVHGRSFRFQFWIKSSLTGTYGLSFRNGSSNRVYATTYTIISANTWEKKTIDIATDAAGTWNFGNTTGLQICWALQVGSAAQGSTLNTWMATGDGDYGTSAQANFCASNSNSMLIAQVALIPGSFDSDINLVFKRCGKNIQEELASCQRYCFNTIEAPGVGSDVIGTGQCNSSTNAAICIPLPVIMRAAPTLDAASSSGSGNFRLTNAADNGVPATTSYSLIVDTSAKVVRLSVSVANGLAAGDACRFFQNGAGTQVVFTAEL